MPRSGIFKKYVKTNKDGFILINAKTQETNMPGVFACGDVTEVTGPYPQAAIAAGNGQIAGYSCVQQLLDAGVPQESVGMNFNFRDRFKFFLKRP